MKMKMKKMKKNDDIHFIFQLNVHVLYLDPYKYITYLTFNHINLNLQIHLLNFMEFIEFLNLNYSTFDEDVFNTLQLPNLLFLHVNHCKLKKIPNNLLDIYWIKEIHAECNAITSISNKFMTLPNLHILNLIGNNINIYYLSSYVYSFYTIGLQEEILDFIKERKKLIAIRESDRIIL